MDLPQLDRMLNDAGAPMIRVAYETEFTEIAALLAAVPALSEAAHAADTAMVVNHLTTGFEYAVILDPETFRADYVARYEAEPDTGWQQGNPRLRDYGTPVLSALAPPEITDGTLVFFAEDKYLGVPYRATMSLADAKTDYQPVSVSE